MVTAVRSAHDFILPRIATTVLLVVVVICSRSVLAGDETRRVEGLDFDEVIVLGSTQVEISQGDEFDLQVRGPAEYLDMGPFKVDGSALVIGSNSSRKGKYFQKLKFRVVMPILRELHVKGSGDVYVKPFSLQDGSRSGSTTVSLNGSGDVKLFGIDGGNLELSVKGSGDIKAADINVAGLEAVVAGSGDLFIRILKAGDVEFTVTGSGDVTVVGSSFANRAIFSVIGSGDVSAAPMDCDVAEANVLGSGTISIGKVLETLEASVIGSGDVRYSGDPKVESVQIGSGEVSPRD